MKTIELTVTLTFSEDIEENEIGEVCENVLEAIDERTNHSFIAPMGSGTSTEYIKVTDPNSGDFVERSI